MRKHQRQATFSEYPVSNSDEEGPTVAPPPPATVYHHTQYSILPSGVSASSSFDVIPDMLGDTPASHGGPDSPQTSPVKESPLDDPDPPAYGIDGINPDDFPKGHDLNLPRARTHGDDPFGTWIPEIDKWLAEIMRLEGRGHFSQDKCSGCGVNEAAY
ncbi:hypothetical protein CERSUDRAFT_96872 [Gelatoporia subvermispora B]|uniref:Uncharacterized protein n=1 Tax=Ceriporiopsis subvermispora (strain B) TaxID=914234 RepID=M2R962_CERS8|nr:hypothetical protein CERSUDRAFT_96872 [Gelatoporia subvermispora B]